jgi:hypothetical protein
MSITVITLDPTPQDVQIDPPATSIGQTLIELIDDLPLEPPAGGGLWSNDGIITRSK